MVSRETMYFLAINLAGGNRLLATLTIAIASIIWIQSLPKRTFSWYPNKVGCDPRTQVGSQVTNGTANQLSSCTIVY